MWLNNGCIWNVQDGFICIAMPVACIFPTSTVSELKILETPPKNFNFWLAALG